MNKFTKELVDDLAAKLLIGLSEEENKMVLDEFEEIDKAINTINEIEGISNIEPMTHCLDDLTIELRNDDEWEDTICIEDLMANCDQVEDREIEVPKVVG